MMLRHTLLISCVMAMLLAGCDRNDETGEDTSTTAAGVDFLMFPNPQASLGVGDYDIVITNSNLVPVNYTLTITPASGANQTLTGTVPAAVIIFLTLIPSSVTESFEQTQAGGVTISLNSGGANVTLTLRNGGTTSLVLPATNVNPVTGANPSISFSRFQIDQAAYTDAYYAAIDPLNDRDTLAKFKAINGFGSSCNPNGSTEFEVKFRDVHDLGYGRHMCARGNTGAAGNVAVWVENFQVSAIPGQNYGRLNLEALIADDRRWHVGTNAIEYAPADPTAVFGPSNPRIVKFYTFNPDGTRRTLVDLDHRGAKAMPIPCISCHGGKALPLMAPVPPSTVPLFPIIAAFPRGEVLARMQPINVDTLDFSDQAPWRRADQEAWLKAINQLVLCTYPLAGAPAGAEDNCRLAPAGAVEWQGTTAEMIKSWYGGNGMPCLILGDPCQAAHDDYVPVGWREPTAGGTAPVGATNLYRTVVAPHCRVCHALRGNANFLASDIDFTEYPKFIGTATYEGFATGQPNGGGGAGGHYNRLLYHVFQKGNMPLAFLKWEQFWESDAPATLASFVPGVTSGGSALRPNGPIAIPGPDRMRLRTGSAVRLSGAGSVNAVNYRWRVTSQPAGTPPTLTNPNTVRPTFTPNADGTYTIELIVNDGNSDSAPVTQTLVSAGTNPDPNSIRWADIRNILQNTGGIMPATPCTAGGCHTNASGNNGPPVFYNDYDRAGTGVLAGTDPPNVHQFYLDMRARLNFTDVEASFLLRRPSGHHHPGGLLTGFDVNNQIGGNRVHYDNILSWILNGAPE